jgi:hypothetical protein
MPVPWRTVSVCILGAIGSFSCSDHRNYFVLERLIGWACAGTIFDIAYADRCLLMLLVLVGAAGLLELAQIEVLQRHGPLSDFFVKAVGGLVGIGSVRALQ